MYRSILVPLDGSAFAEHALPLALGIARRSGAPLQFVQVHTPFVYLENGLALGDRLDQQLRAEEQAYLDGVVKRLAGVSPVRVTATLYDGSVPDCLREHAATNSVDLIVMTTHGRGPLSRFWLGSVADELVRSAGVPLLLVRPREGAPDLGREPTLRHVLIPLDGSPLAEEIFGQAVLLGRLLDADYRLLRVVKPVLFPGHDPTVLEYPRPGQPATEQLRAEAVNYLEGVATRLRGQSLRVDVRVNLDTQPAVSILQESADLPQSMIALATHGRGALTRAVVGSVADKVIRGATTPVLVYRPVRE
jgi:nucleotide-binding universal stress UspA family protein